MDVDSVGHGFCLALPSLNLTANAPENRPLIKGDSELGNHQFEGLNVSFRECMLPKLPKLHEISLRKRESSHEFVSLKITRFLFVF